MYKIELTSIDSIDGILNEIHGYFPNGKIDEKGFKVDNVKESFSYSIINFLGAFHVVLFEGYLGEDTQIKIKPNSNKSLVMRFILESSVLHQDRELSIGEGLENGACLYNSYSEQKLFIEKGKTVKWLAVHIPIERWLEFTESKWETLNSIVENVNPWILFESMTPKLSTLIKDVFAYNTLDIGRKGFIVSKTIELVTHFMIQLHKRGNDAENIGVPDVEISKLYAVRELLNKQLNEPPSMEDLASSFAMSETKLRSNFKKVFGMPPYQYVLKERLNESYRLLESTDRSLTDIALTLGFNDQSHFTKSFKKVFECLPSSVR
ncbi:helix-turn-helix transcriptional regulator [Lutimonas sp.]|uniref:helix-turn-helix transcriptional regulator n=1 Tax=Lutimonas sp. TaxID=1872403 RepID=UPI003D9ABAC3